LPSLDEIESSPGMLLCEEQLKRKKKKETKPTTQNTQQHQTQTKNKETKNDKRAKMRKLPKFEQHKRQPIKLRTERQKINKVRDYLSSKRFTWQSLHDSVSPTVVRTYEVLSLNMCHYQTNCSIVHT
jgi:hypothetical protein